MILNVEKPYIWLPVSKNAPERKLHFYIEGKKVQEIDIHLGKTDCEFYGCWDASVFLGKELQIEGADRELLEGIFCYRKPYDNVYPYRPKLHAAPITGWHNDPNGMVYADGFYHLYYQWNPYGSMWGNMQWGHVKSKDLYHWEQEGLAIAPDETGTVYSGCGIQDKDNLTGYGEGALLYFYTAAGGRNQWSVDAGNLFTQRLAFSTDGGKTLQRSEKFCMPHIVNENRVSAYVIPGICFSKSEIYLFFPQQNLYFFPLPHGHGSLRPTFLPTITVPDFFCSIYNLCFVSLSKMSSHIGRL